MLDGLGQDVRFAGRMALRNPGFVLVATLTLGLGIGANTALFGILHAVLYGDLRFPEPDRTLRLRDAQIEPGGAVHSFNAAARHVLAIRERSTVFDGIVALSGESATLLEGPRPERVSVVSSTDGWNSTLGVLPVLGRSFSEEEYRRGRASAVAQVSYTLWQSRLGGTPGVLGRSIRVGGESFAIVGVMPPGFRFPYDADLWVPVQLDPADRAREYAVFAHLKAGTTRGQAAAELGAIATLVRERYPETPPGYAVTAMTLRENLTDHQEGAMVSVGYVIGFLLALASVNVASLLLVKAVERRRELAIRRALGATPLRQLRQLLSESLLLALAGCGVGLVLTLWLARAAGLLVPSNISEQLGLSGAPLDPRLFAFACLLALLVGALSGLVPATSSTGRDLPSSLGEGGRSAGPGRAGRRLLNLLVLAEAAVGLVLLAGAGLMMQNFLRLEGRALGFEPRGLLTVKLTPPWSDYGTAARRSALAREVLSAVQSIPGALSAGITTVNPLGGGTWTAPILVEGVSRGPDPQPFNVNHRLVTPGLLRTMGIPVHRGRDIAPTDDAGSEPVAVVSTAMAARYWPGEDPLGKRVRLARPGAPWLRVVGVAGDVRDARDAGDPTETWYLPLHQQAGSRASEDFYLMVRSDADPRNLVARIDQEVFRLDPSLVPYDVAAMDRYYADSLVRERLAARFMGALAAFGLLVAGLGIYGVTAFTVTRRTHEVGLRKALGARAADILLLVMARALGPVAAGLAFGLAGAFALNSILAARLAEVRPWEWTVPLGAVLAFGLVAALGVALPARRAAGLDPMAALREE